MISLYIRNVIDTVKLGAKLPQQTPTWGVIPESSIGG